MKFYFLKPIFRFRDLADNEWDLNPRTTEVILNTYVKFYESFNYKKFCKFSVCILGFGFCITFTKE